MRCASSEAFPIGTADGSPVDVSEDLPGALPDPVGVGAKGVTRRGGTDRGGFWRFGAAVDWGADSCVVVTLDEVAAPGASAVALGTGVGVGSTCSYCRRTLLT